MAPDLECIQSAEEMIKSDCQIELFLFSLSDRAKKLTSPP